MFWLQESEMAGAAGKRTRRRTTASSASDGQRTPAGEWASLPPNINREDPPPFSQMAFARFEEMTCSLLDKEPGVVRADLYHTRFDAQYGIDCFGDLDAGMIVASCKCQKSIKKGEMAQWSDDFLRHWESLWQSQGVR